MAKFILLLFIPVLVFAFTTDAYNILVTVVGASGSQNLIMYRMAEIFGKRGHSVTMFKRDMFPEAKTIKLEHAKELVYKFSNTSVIDELREGFNSFSWSESKMTLVHLKVMVKIFGALSSNCQDIVNDETLLNRLKSEKYDVIITHFADFCSLGVAHKLGIKGTILMSTAFLADFMAWYSNSPMTPSYIVSQGNTVTDEMTFLERCQNLLLSITIASAFQYGIVNTYTDIFRNKFGPDFPSLGELLSNTQLTFVNSDHFFEYPRPVPPNVIYVGGLTMKNAEPLTEKWQKIIDEAGDAGVVVFSLGSVANTSSMPAEIKRKFINAFKQIPQKVIWKLEGDTSEVTKVPNIYVADWLPQKDLVGNPKVRALLTHGGYNSLTEATYLGVPLIMFPLFGDQHANCKRVERLKVGVILKRENLTEYSILEALKGVLNNKEIQANARRLGRMIRSKPESSEDLAVKWVEFLAEFQDLDQLKPASRKLNIAQYLLLDVAFTCFFVFVLSVYVLCKCFSCCCRKVCKSRKSKTD